MSETPRTALSADLWNAAVHQKDDAFAEALDSLVALVKEETLEEAAVIADKVMDGEEWPRYHVAEDIAEKIRALKTLGEEG